VLAGSVFDAEFFFSALALRLCVSAVFNPLAVDTSNPVLVSPKSNSISEFPKTHRDQFKQGDSYVVGCASAMRAIVVVSKARQLSNLNSKPAKETTMVTITQVIQHLVGEQSRKIYEIKTAAITRQPMEKFAYVSPDGKTISDHREGDGWKMQKVVYEKITGHISPRHPGWQAYQSARNFASLLLTARLILKIGNDDVPEISALRQALREGRLSHHAHRGHARSLAFKAYRFLRKISNRLNRAPERFNHMRRKEEAGV
jgi:hypothetical protein